MKQASIKYLFFLTLLLLIPAREYAQAIRYEYFPSELMKSEKVSEVKVWRIRTDEVQDPGASRKLKVARMPVEEHQFDREGRKIRSLIFDENGALKHEIVAEYNDLGKLTMEDYYYYAPDSSIRLKRRSTIEYGKDGKELGKYSGYVNPGDNSPGGKKDSLLYQYNVAGDLVRKSYRFTKGYDRVEQEFRIVCSPMAVQCTEESYFFGQLWDRWVRTRDENGNDIKVEYSIPDEPDKIWTWSLTYDENQRLKSWTMETELGMIEENKKTTIHSQENLYDPKGKLKESTRVMRDKSTWKIMYEYIYK